MADKENIPQLLFLKFEDSKLPLFVEKPNKEWIQFGETDDYPDYLLLLSNKSAKHNAIVNGKVNYIFGNGLQSVNPGMAEWIEKCNQANEGMDDIAIKSIKDNEVFGGFYWCIIPNVFGEIVDIHHVDFKSVRTNKTRDKFYYKKNWADRKEEMVEYPVYTEGSKATCIFSFREYRQGQGTYPLPNYISAINYIESDYEVSKQTLSNAKTGFSASKFINFYGGEPSEDQKKDIQKRFERAYGGSDGKKFIMGFNNDPAKKPTIEDLGSSDLTKENFTNVDDLICANIYAGHQITSPMLFGIQESGKLGAGNELKFAYDIFKNTYVNFKQKQIESVINYFAGIIFKTKGDLKLQDVDPVGLPLSDQVIIEFAPVGWIWKKLGINPDDYPGQQPAISKVGKGAGGGGTSGGGDQQMVNENVKNLTTKQHQQLTRIIRQHSKGQLTDKAAKALLKSGLGLSDTEINDLLGLTADEQKFEREYTEEEVAEMFSTVGDSKQDFEIIKSREAKFSDEEFSVQECFDAVETETDVRPDLVVGKPIYKKGGPGVPQIAIKYSYEVKPGAGAKIIPTSRPFCRRLVGLDKLWTRGQIQQISMQVGYPVFDRAGGFWNNHGNVEQSCRHRWMAHVVIKKNIA